MTLHACITIYFSKFYDEFESCLVLLSQTTDELKYFERAHGFRDYDFRLYCVELKIVKLISVVHMCYKKSVFKNHEPNFVKKNHGR